MRTGLVAILGVMAGMGAACAQQAAVVTVGPPVTVESAQENAPSAAQLAKDVARIRASISAGDASRYVAVSPGCPGQLSARQQATGGATVWTAALEDQRNMPAQITRPTGLGIHVEFVGAKTAVKAIELRVSYLPVGLRLMPVDPTFRNTAAGSPQEREKTFDLNREAAMRIGGNLLVGPAATITRVHLVSATFADGSVWHAASENACTVEPNRVMEVAAR